MYQKTISIDGKELYFESGKIAKQADGAVLIGCGETQVLVTAVASKEERDIDFFPLTVEVEEKMYAAGKIPGGFFKREGRPSEKAILTARLIDRPLRPSFPDGFKKEVQIIATIMSVDMANPFDVLALNAASLALHISDIPFNGPIAAVRIGMIEGELVVNPTYQELETSKLDLIVAGCKDGILMVEAGAEEVSESDMLKAFDKAREVFEALIVFQDEVRSEIGKEKRSFEPAPVDDEITSAVNEQAAGKIKEAFHINESKERKERLDEIEKELNEKLVGLVTNKIEVKNSAGEVIGTIESLDEKRAKKIGVSFDKLKKNILRNMVLDENRRADGRKADEIREITCEVGVLPRTHGSGLFTRGQTQVLTLATLGTVREEQMIDGITLEESKRYMHHYNFTPFSTGETGRVGSPKRREIGHGALAERALMPVIPKEDVFPYTIRLVSEVLESNGSTSMASVCGSTLSLMDAGIPIAKPVAGIAMGLIKEDDRVAVLTDILGLEDALGDMDFKVAGTKEGITALQMDIKSTGLSGEIFEQALAQARDARLFILEKIQSTLDKPRGELSRYAPRIITIQIDKDKIREVIGPGGKMINSIIDETGATIDIEQDGTVFIYSREEDGAKKAREIIENIVKEVEVGEVYNGTVTRIMNFGAFVELLPGKEGLVHISKMAPRRIATVEDYCNVGDKVMVKVVEIDSQNRVNLATLEYLESPGSRENSGERDRRGGPPRNYRDRDRR